MSKSVITVDELDFLDIPDNTIEHKMQKIFDEYDEKDGYISSPVEEIFTSEEEEEEDSEKYESDDDNKKKRKMVRCDLDYMEEVIQNTKSRRKFISKMKLSSAQRTWSHFVQGFLFSLDYNQDYDKWHNILMPQNFRKQHKLLKLETTNQVLMVCNANMQTLFIKDWFHLRREKERLILEKKFFKKELEYKNRVIEQFWIQHQAQRNLCYIIYMTEEYGFTKKKYTSAVIRVKFKKWLTADSFQASILNLKIKDAKISSLRLQAYAKKFPVLTFELKANMKILIPPSNKLHETSKKIWTCTTPLTQVFNMHLKYPTGFIDFSVLEIRYNTMLAISPFTDQHKIEFNYKQRGELYYKLPHTSGRKSSPDFSPHTYCLELKDQALTLAYVKHEFLKIVRNERNLFCFPPWKNLVALAKPHPKIVIEIASFL